MSAGFRRSYTAATVHSNLHRVADFHHCVAGHDFGFFRACLQDVFYVAGMRLPLLAALVDWPQPLLETFKKPHFAFDTAYSGGATTLVHLGNLIFVGKNVVIVANGANVGVSG